jgi:hypothetical protein
MRRLIICLCSLLIAFACGEKEIGDKIHQTEVKTDVKTNTPAKATPSFNEDSCYQYVQQQIDFGPRVPNTAAHDSCAVYLTNMLRSFGAETMVQKGEVIAYTNSALSIQNIIGRFYKQRSKRIMLCAHWDTRHIADRDPVNPQGPIQGANDGASGVAVLLEIGRHLMATDPGLGVDLIFFDAEDYGTPQLAAGMTALSDMDNSWCLGSQYWAKNPPISGYKPQFGILLDMVAASNATFPKEGFSLKYANPIVQAIWSKAQKLGYGKYFINRAIGGITDDHKYVNEISGIPVVDIIHYNPGKSDFGIFHHTHNDNITIIDKQTMSAVGTVCLEIIYQGL